MHPRRRPGSVRGGPAAGPGRPRPAPEDAYRAFHDGVTSGKKEEQEKALKAILPTRKDVEYLFPRDADKLWPVVEAGNEFLLKNLDKVAEEEARPGAIKSIKCGDLRQGPGADSYKKVLTMIPKDVPVVDIYVHGEKGGGGTDALVYVNGRWIFIRNLNVYPDILEKLK